LYTKNWQSCPLLFSAPFKSQVNMSAEKIQDVLIYLQANETDIEFAVANKYQFRRRQWQNKFNFGTPIKTISQLPEN
jgi:hypothetical protein